MGSTFRYSGDELYHYGRSIKDGAPGVGTGNWRRHGPRKPDKDVDEMIRNAYGNVGESVGKMKSRIATSKNRIANRMARVGMKAANARTKMERTIATSKENFHKNKMETLQRKTEEQEAKNKLTQKQLEGEKLESQADREAAKYQREDDRQKAQDAEEAKKKQTEQDAKDNASVNGAKAWRGWTNEELQAYITRQNLEKAADQVKMNQLDRPRQYAYEAMGYAKMGIDAINTFSEFSKAYNTLLHPEKQKQQQQGPDTTMTNILAGQAMGSLIASMNQLGSMALESEDFKNQLKSASAMIENMSKVEKGLYKENQNGGNNQNQNKNDDKKKNK